MRELPTAPRSPSHGIARRPGSPVLLGPGPMPPRVPHPSLRRASEPVRRPTFSGGGAEVKNSEGLGGEGGGGDDNSDDLPPPANPKMGHTISFDPNRVDTEFQKMVFPFPPST